MVKATGIISWRRNVSRPFSKVGGLIWLENHWLTKSANILGNQLPFLRLQSLLNWMRVFSEKDFGDTEGYGVASPALGNSKGSVLSQEEVVAEPFAVF